jgi:D-alanyl-D-alanine carboxypeptidase/D-alanyl-D-alanine-endopeptidase (penicillin-binding protein 4)
MKIIFLLCLFLITNNAISSLTDDVRQMIKSQHFKDKNLGIIISEDEKPVVEINAKNLMIPASLTKIVTAGAVLTKLPLNTKFQTSLLSDGKIEEGKLQGALCLKGGGDPSFVSEKMWFLVNEFMRNEVKQVNGDLIIDSSRFDDEFFDKGRESTRVDRAFDAPISAISFNWNSVNVFVRPGKKEKDPARVFIDPVNDYIELENRAHTFSGSGKKTIEVSRTTKNGKDIITVTGGIPLGGVEHVSYKSISNPNLWAGSHLKEFLKERGISVSGTVKIGKCSTSAIKLASVDSKNLNEMLSDMLKFSNNFVAEMLAKNLSAIKNPNQSAKMSDGIEEIKNYLDSIGIKKSTYELENVSGLTRENKFTPEQLSKVLYSIKNDFQVYPEFLSGLPIAGMDGTLKNRMKGEGESNVRAKTGYLDGVTGLAGYIGRKNKPALVFVFMFNGDYEDGISSRRLFDTIIERVKKWD